jgi:hypothetical protein
MVYDPALGSVVLFGGLSGNTVLGDLWTYDGGLWTPAGEGVPPTPRGEAATTFDLATGVMVVEGGAIFKNGAPSGLSQTWFFGDI